MEVKMSCWKVLLASITISALISGITADDERWVWGSKPSSSKSGSTRGGRSILGQADPRVVHSHGQPVGRMYFPDESRYAEPSSGASSYIKFQPTQNDQGTSPREAKRLDFEYSKNSLRPPAVVGRVKNFPDGGGSGEYNNDAKVIGERSPAYGDIPVPNLDFNQQPVDGLSPDDFLKLQNAYSPANTDQITPYSGTQQVNDPIYSLGHEYLTPGSDESLEAVYYTGSGGMYDGEPPVPNYINSAGPDFTYGGGCAEGHQYQLIDDPQNADQGTFSILLL